MPRQPRPWFWAQRGAWCVDLAGRRHILARGKGAKAEATDEFHRLMASKGRADVASPARLTTADLFDAFLDAVAGGVERGERSKDTYDSYVRFLSAAAKRFGAVRAAELSPHKVHLWAEAPESAWNPTTRANAITAVKAAFRWGRRRALIPTNPVADMEKPRRERRKAVLTDDQVRAVLAATEGTPFADLIFALWESGCRPKEVVSLTADRADPEAGTWTVGNKTRHKTAEDDRTVYLTPALRDLTRRLKAEHPEGLLFRNARGNPWTRNAQACAWGRLRRRLGFGPEATSYAVRHRYAIEGLRSGLDPSEVAALMGHKDVNMVNKVYGHWDEQHERLSAAAQRVRPRAAGDGGSPAPTPPGGAAPPPDAPPGTPPTPLP